MKGFFLIALLTIGCTAKSTGKNVWKPKPQPPSTLPKPETTLRLVHVLFRHGNRNPENGSVWDGNLYSDVSYYPEGWGQLTNKGKMTEYKLGQMLRERYDSLLGDIWNIDYVDFRCTDYNRTKMSGELVMAGLWPPRGSNVWNKDLAWQPIPYNYAQASEDKLLLGSSSTAFAIAFIEILSNSDMLRYLAGRYNETMQILSENTGCSTTNYIEAVTYYDTMNVQSDLGFDLPEWTSQVYPEPLKSLAVDMYYIMTNNTALRKAIAGPLVKKILMDTNALKNGTLSPSTRKMFAYSAHDINVGSMYLSLDATNMFETPPYGSAVLFEVHEIENVWGIKLFLVDYTPGSPHPLSIPGCRHFCPIDRFYFLVEKILP